VNDGWKALALLAGGAFCLKAAAPVLLGGRALPPLIDRLATRLPAPLLAALTVVAAIADGRSLQPDARLVGVAAAAVALWRRAGFVAVVSIAAAAAALARAAGMS
jgi:hypothetical protein